MTILSGSIQLWTKTATQWTSLNPVLLIGQKGFESDTRKEKTGNGVDDWNTLQYDSGGEVVSVVVIENISQFDVVNGDGSKADSSIVGKRNRAIGIAINSINNGFSGDVRQVGQITNGGWAWTKGLAVYLNGSSLSHTAPNSGFIQKIGIATSTITIEVSINQSILI